MIGAALPAGAAFRPFPTRFPPSTFPSSRCAPHASLWNNLPAPIASVQPRPFEMYGQNQGLVLYRTTLVGRKSGKLADHRPARLRDGPGGRQG